MGQYYCPTIIKNKKVKSKSDIVVWFYSHNYNNGLKLMEHSYKGNNFINAIRNWLIDTGGGRLVWAGDYANEEAESKPNIYGYAGELRPTNYSDEGKPKYHFYNNHDKHEFVDLDKCQSKDEWGYTIEPLPLLTCEGNGRGCGDYEGSCMELVGSWARDFISCDTKPVEGYKEITPDFREKGLKYV